MLVCAVSSHLSEAEGNWSWEWGGESGMGYREWWVGSGDGGGCEGVAWLLQLVGQHRCCQNHTRIVLRRA